jgi:hypothetical protein
VGHDSQGVSQVATNSSIALPAASLQVHTHAQQHTKPCQSVPLTKPA